MNEKERLDKWVKDFEAKGVNLNPIISSMGYQGNYWWRQKQLDGTWKSWPHKTKPYDNLIRNKNELDKRKAY